MTKRVHYMNDHGYAQLEKEIVDGFERVEAEVVTLRNIMTKYSITGNKDDLRLIISRLPEVAEEEFSLIHECIASVEHIESRKTVGQHRLNHASSGLQANPSTRF